MPNHATLQLAALCITRAPTKEQRVFGLDSVLPAQLIALFLLRLQSPLVRRSPLVLILAKLQKMHLIRSIHDPHRPSVAVHSRQRRILRHARTTVSLYRAVDDSEHDVRDENLYFGDLLERALCGRLVDLDGCVEDGQTRRVDLDARAGHALEHDAMLVQHLAERLLPLVVDAGQEPFERLLGGADAAHGVVDASRSQTPLDDLETTALAKNHVASRHAYVVECDVAVAVGGVVVAEDGEHAVDGDARGVVRHENHGLLPILVRVVGIGLSEDDVDLAAGVANARRPPFL